LVLSVVAPGRCRVWWDDKHVGMALPPAKNHPARTHGGNCYALIFVVTTDLRLCLCLRRERLTSCLPFRDTPHLAVYRPSSSSTQLNLHTLLLPRQLYSSSIYIAPPEAHHSHLPASCTHSILRCPTALTRSTSPIRRLSCSPILFHTQHSQLQAANQ
jgi:hypothetical protein